MIGSNRTIILSIRSSRSSRCVDVPAVCPPLGPRSPRDRERRPRERGFRRSPPRQLLEPSPPSSLGYRCGIFSLFFSSTHLTRRDCSLYEKHLEVCKKGMCSERMCHYVFVFVCADSVLYVSTFHPKRCSANPRHAKNTPPTTHPQKKDSYATTRSPPITLVL